MALDANVGSIAQDMKTVVNNSMDKVKDTAESLKSNSSDISAGDILLKSIDIDSAKDAATLAGNIAKSSANIQTKTVQQSAQ